MDEGMTPLQQELDNLKERTKQRIRLDTDEIKQANQLIQTCTQRIERNKELLKEMSQHEEIYHRREVPTNCACEEGKERCPYCD